MLARYEELNEFIETLKEEAARKDNEQPVYISIVRTQDESNNLTTQIFIQVRSYDDNNLVLTHCYSDLPAIKVVAPALFDSAFGANETSAAAKKKYEADALEVTTKILEEKAKIVVKLQALGFKKFINANLQ